MPEEKKITRRKEFDMKAYYERLLDESDDLKNFPLKIRKCTCDRVSWPVNQLNKAFKEGNYEEIERLRAQILSAVFQMDEME